MSYQNPYIFQEKTGNNNFAYDIRKNKSLIIPSLVEGSLDDVKVGPHIVFEELDDGIIQSCLGLDHFIRLNDRVSRQNPLQQITIFDNHNHALYFWLEAIRNGILQPGFELIHIDEHSDLWDNTNTLDYEKAIHDGPYAWDFTNFSCNVGNYIKPAIEAGIIGKMIRIENEFELDECMSYTPPKNSVLNLDLDFFAPEMEFIPEVKKIQCIKNLMKYVECITIATSPYFIDQGIAIEKLKKIFT